MRSLNTSVLNSLDLSVEEIAFLAPKAAQEHASTAQKYRYIPDPKRQFSEWLSAYGPKDLSPEEYIQIQVMHLLSHRTKPFESIRTVETKLDGEFGTHHSSYGSVSLSSPSSSRVDLVGSSTLASHYMEFNVQFGRLFTAGESSHLMSDIGLVRAAMSVEQFSILIRGGDGIMAPVKLQVIAEGLADRPPALTPIVANRRNFEADVREAAQPFIQVMKAISKALASDLSKKANRVALAECATAAKMELANVKARISEMTVAAGEVEAARVQRQFDTEIRERMSVMGIEHLNDFFPRLN